MLFEKGSYKEQNRTIELAAIFAVPVMDTGLRYQTDARQPRVSCEMLRGSRPQHCPFGPVGNL